MLGLRAIRALRGIGFWLVSDGDGSFWLSSRVVLRGMEVAFEPYCLERHEGGLRAVKVACEPLGLVRHGLLACERRRCVFFGLTSHCVCERFVLGGVKLAYKPCCLERHEGGLRAVKTAYEP